MSNFSRFQARNKAGKVAERKLNTSFIFQGYPSTSITNLDRTVQAAVVNKEEKDMAYVFTQLQDTLPIGSVWTVKNLHLLISKEMTVIADVNWHKYHSFLCNVQIGDQWGFFKGPGKSFLDIVLEQKVVLDSPQKPVLVLPDKVLDFKDKIVIKDRAWIIQEYDAITTEGLVYYSLKPTTVSKEVIEANKGKDVFVEKHENNIDQVIVPPIEILTTDGEIRVSANTPITLSTEEGFFKYDNRNIKIKKHSGSEVIFELPFGVSEVAVQIRQDGQIINKKYCVVK